jgi:hypothetical protein
VRAEFFRADAPDQPVGRVAWRGAEVVIEDAVSQDEQRIRRILRPTPVVADDEPRAPGTSGPTVLAPGSLRWFAAAARARAPAEGLSVRFVPSTGNRMGFDPAGLYRRFDEQADLRERG